MKIGAIRASLQNVNIPKSATHPGLVFNRYLQEHDKKGQSITSNESALSSHIAAVADPKINSEAYTHIFNRWHATMTTMPDHVCTTIKIDGRMIIGLGNESITETGITLHHTYGVPYIPGSALKGLTAHYTKRSVDFADTQSQKAREILFGTTDDAGYITFYDALPEPGTFQIAEDVLTVHHQKYYNGPGLEPPSDFDSPNPVPFLSVTGTFHVVLAGPQEWRNLAQEFMKEAVKQEGLGAKTSSGYGRGQSSKCTWGIAKKK